MPKPLTTKQQAFVAFFFITWNESEAAKRAGYANPYNNAHRLMEHDGIAAAIAARLAELKMSADEVLVRLTEHARGSIAPFMRRSPDGALHGFDLGDDRPLNLLHKVSITKRTIRDMTEEKITLELYDAQAALVHLGKAHGLFIERTETTVDFIGDAVSTLERKLISFAAPDAPAGDPEEPDTA